MNLPGTGIKINYIDMKVEKTGFEGLLIIEPQVFGDARGYFYESYNPEKFKAAGIDIVFVQDNLSKSAKGTIRGLHYQAGEKAQDKLCYVISGAVLDVAVDIRYGSPTFGKYFACELTGENKKQLLIPKGFAHGFSVLADETIFAYKVSAPYSPIDERTILFSDEGLAIDWKVEKPIVSEKDLKGIPFKDIAKEFIYSVK